MFIISFGDLEGLQSADDIRITQRVTSIGVTSHVGLVDTVDERKVDDAVSRRIGGGVVDDKMIAGLVALDVKIYLKPAWL